MLLDYVVGTLVRPIIFVQQLEINKMNWSDHLFSFSMNNKEEILYTTKVINVYNMII